MSRSVNRSRVGAAAVFLVFTVFVWSARAADFNDIQEWIGSGGNQAGFEIDWYNGTTDTAYCWGYRWNGTATGEQMLDAIVAADPRLYAEISGPTQYGTQIFGLGYDLDGDQPFALSPSLTFNNQHLAYTDYSGVDDSRTAVNSGDLWEEGWYNLGYWSYWNSTDSRLAANPSDWDSAAAGMTDRVLSDGDWDGWRFSYNYVDSPPVDPAAATPVPEPAALGLLGIACGCLLVRRRSRRAAVVTIVAAGAGMSLQPRSARADYVYNANNFATQVVSSNLNGESGIYGNPNALLGAPTITFNDPYDPTSDPKGYDNVKIIEAPYDTDYTTGQDALTEIPQSTATNTYSVTVQMGQPISHNSANPFGMDLIVYGNSYFTGGAGNSGLVGDSTNLSTFTVGGGIFGHAAIVAVSPDNVHWFTFPTVSVLLPYQAYQWDDATQSSTTNLLNFNEPVDPAVAAKAPAGGFSGDTAAQILDAYGDAAGGTAFNLQDALDSNGMTLAQDGYSSIDYVRISSTTSDSTVVDAIAAVVPEPTTAGLLFCGGVLLLRRRIARHSA